MSAPDLTALKQDITSFDADPYEYSLADAKALRKRIYHAMYYDDQGWRKMDTLDHAQLARAIVRIKSIEPELYDPSIGMYK